MHMHYYAFLGDESGDILKMLLRYIRTYLWYLIFYYYTVLTYLHALLMQQNIKTKKLCSTATAHPLMKEAVDLTLSIPCDM